MYRNTIDHYQYQMYESAHLAMTPARVLSHLTRLSLKNPLNPMTHTALGRNLAASTEFFERMIRPYGKPAFGLSRTVVSGKEVGVQERVVWERPFCRLLHFQRDMNFSRPQPRSPTVVNVLAERRGTEWFRRHCISTVPFPYPGVGRSVCSGFLQLSSFVAMNPRRHVNAHVEMFSHLVRGDDSSAEKHREFYDEFLTVMDLTAEYYLQTIDTVFVRHALPKSEMRHRGEKVDLTAIRHTSLMTVEGEKDDITGVGQTYAAQDLCSSIPALRKAHYTQNGVGHYGVFSGSRFRAEIAPRINDFIANVNQRLEIVGYSNREPCGRTSGRTSNRFWAILGSIPR
jgi:poly-beta-hydroxyalkanoate depolymerase